MRRQDQSPATKLDERVVGHLSQTMRCKAAPVPFRPALQAALATRSNRGVSEKRFHLRCSHGVRMLDAVDADVAFDPVHLGLLRAVGEMPDTGELPDLVQEFHGSLRAKVAPENAC